MREIEKRKKNQTKKKLYESSRIDETNKKMLKMTIYSYADKKDMH